MEQSRPVDRTLVLLQPNPVCLPRYTSASNTHRTLQYCTDGILANLEHDIGPRHDGTSLTGAAIPEELSNPLGAVGLNPAKVMIDQIKAASGVGFAEDAVRNSLIQERRAVLEGMRTIGQANLERGILGASGLFSAQRSSKQFAFTGLMGGFAGPSSASRLGIGDSVAGFATGMDNVVKPLMGFSNAINQWSTGVTESLSPIARNLQRITTPAFNLDPLVPKVVTSLQHFADQQRRVFEGITRTLQDHDLLGVQNLNRNLLPPNLREASEEIDFGVVLEFLQEEGIPLYLVPRAQTALRFLRAADRPARRQILNECYDSIVDDCEALLDQVNHPDVETEAEFALNGVAALRGGHTRAAQALSTLTLDTLISRIHPERRVRTKITNRKPNAAVPETINGMGFRDVTVWLPVWNAHGQFWPNQGIPVPWDYSRHATVHKVSRKQYSQRNTIQSLMLVTSLIGHADRLELSLP